MATTVQTDHYPKGTPRHKQGERLTCPRNGAEVTGAFCFTYCDAAVIDECGQFHCELLDGEEAATHALPSQAR